jgi:hypothetical protein
MDFYQIRTKESKEGLEIFPDWTVGRSTDLMVQGKTFYAIWDEDRGLWSRDEYDVQRLVDEDLRREAEHLKQETGAQYRVKSMESFGSNTWTRFRTFLSNIGDNNHPLDTKLIFADTEVTKKDYATKRLPYALEEGDTSAWDELVGTLYSVEERQKIEWAIGAIVAGDSKSIQKFMVFYGAAGTGKSTILNIIEKLFEGYTTTFDGRALGNSNSSFATEVFKANPLVAIQHDGDLSRIEDNTRLNSIISHELMTMNEKYKPSYTSRAQAFLFIGSNQPVKITDSKSGLIRRLIDVHPTGVRLPARHYEALMSRIDFELGAIAHKCLMEYLRLGKNYYNGYRPLEMMLQTDVFYNFIEYYYDIFKERDQITLKEAYSLYKEYCEDSGIDRPVPQYKMREELRNYFNEFHDRGEVDGKRVRSLYVGFTAEKFRAQVEDGVAYSLVMEETTSLLDEELADCKAQLATSDGVPGKPWSEVKTKLLDIDSRQIHFVRPPENHIVIDFDLKDVNGVKALERNLEAASQWPPTYGELSKSGQGVHLHYIYAGDVSTLATEFSEGIEIKLFRGKASLRRKLTKCNAVRIATISTGIPLKKRQDKVLQSKKIASEQGLRELIERNLRKEIHPGTKSSVDFISKVLDDAYESGMPYDVSDLRPRIIAFANNSSNQASTALRVVVGMKFKSESEVESDADVVPEDDRIAFFDVEVYSNLFVICWKFQGSPTVVQMVNPTADQVAELFKLKLVGFNNRQYDNHILYAAAQGYSVDRLFQLSQKIIVDNNKNAKFGAAYNLSFADIYDFSSEKKSLKRFEIDLGIYHMELDIPWDQPVPEDKWDMVVRYCVNDVVATEAVFEDRKGDFVARSILANLSGLSVNDTTQKHTARIIFGDAKNPSRDFVYTDLSKEFPGYKFELGKSSYKGEEPSEGGYVYAEPGAYREVALLDVASMHPTSIEVLNLFGPYTQNFSDLKQARMAIKRKDFAAARTMLDGRLAPFLENEDGAEKLAYALKIVINIVYGLTSAKFDNPFRDVRNRDNIVAKRGALFMIELQKHLQEKGITVAHIKTDSIKIPEASAGTIEDIILFGAEYGYDFEHEATYDVFCLVNDAVYIARKGDQWIAVGSQFQHPFVLKTLFTGEELKFEDYCESRSVVKGTMYLDTTGDAEPDVTKMRHLGRTGMFVPVLTGGGRIFRVNEGKYYAVAKTKGHLWIEAEVARQRDDLEIDTTYFEKLRDEAIAAIEQFVSFDEFVNNSRGS